MYSLSAVGIFRSAPRPKRAWSGEPSCDWTGCAEDSPLPSPTRLAGEAIRDDAAPARRPRDPRRRCHPSQNEKRFPGSARSGTEWCEGSRPYDGYSHVRTAVPHPASTTCAGRPGPNGDQMVTRFCFPATPLQTLPVSSGGNAVAILVIIVIIVVLNPDPALVAACASLTLAAGRAGR